MPKKPTPKKETRYQDYNKLEIGTSKVKILYFLIIAFIIGLIVGATLVSTVLFGPQKPGMGLFGNYSQQQATYQPGNFTTIALPARSNINVIAVTENGEGIIGHADVEIIQGRGRVLVNTNPFIEPDTQQSAETATRVAADITGKKLDAYDVIISFNMSDNGTQAQVLGGPSAGAAITLAVLSAIEGKPLRSDISATGTVEKDGTIGPVGAVFEKAQAAGKAGIKTFFIPEGLGNVTFYERNVEEQQSGGFRITKVTYLPKTLNIGNFTMEQYNMTVIEASNIKQLLPYVFSE